MLRSPGNGPWWDWSAAGTRYSEALRQNPINEALRASLPDCRSPGTRRMALYSDDRSGPFGYGIPAGGTARSAGQAGAGNAFTPGNTSRQRPPLPSCIGLDACSVHNMCTGPKVDYGSYVVACWAVLATSCSFGATEISISSLFATVLGHH